MATSIVRRPPRLGKKQIFLPNFILTFVRNEKLPPTFASFIVPLNLNKFDLRDYLWNAYGVRVLSVRSYIQQQKITQDKPGAQRPNPRRWFRPRSIKKMMVELENPFVWPAEPENFDQWDKKIYDAANKDQEDLRDKTNPESKKQPTKERASIAEQAEALLTGKDEWKTSNKEIWEDIGDAVEVEKDISLPKD